ncbi:hypothetical protein EJB05_00117 [Eragrostis curvula]|uniref:Uncharacterized protein n=1 Tax=Eragrostis curvula TaxID=38414 RepID=A0A5J9WKQ3_9POAL|nr:hypothetical protein EJB05_00117 [Eragrostis curvula]
MQAFSRCSVDRTPCSRSRSRQQLRVGADVDVVEHGNRGGLIPEKGLTPESRVESPFSLPAQFRNALKNSLPPCPG